jgi:hypothetical protein
MVISLVFQSFPGEAETYLVKLQFCTASAALVRYDLSWFTPFLLEDALLQTGIPSFPEEADTYVIKL